MVINDDTLGGGFVPNPNYKPKSKKNKEPKVIQDITAPTVQSAGADFIAGSADMRWKMDNPERFLEQGITPNLVSKNLNNELARAQGNFTKFGNALAQTVVSEIGLGTVKGLSDLVDAVGQLTGLSDHDYSNPVSQFLEQKQEEFKEFAPIYVEDGVNISNGGLLNAGWWASNLPSIASSLTLLIPSTGVVKGLSYLGKLSKIGAATRTGIRSLEKFSKLAKVAKLADNPKVLQMTNMAIENGVNALLQRTMENYQEARGVYSDMYNEAKTTLGNMSDAEYSQWVKNHQDKLQDVDYNNRDEAAKAIARNSADEDFRNNYVNTISDVIQMYALKNAFGGKAMENIGRGAANKAQREVLRDAARQAGKEVKENLWTKAKDHTTDFLFKSKLAVGAQLGEGLEEGVNTISQLEAMDTGRVLLGTSNGSSFDSRLKSYAQSPQLWESMFWGVLGGVVFEAGGSKLNQMKYNLEHKNDKSKTGEDTTTGENNSNSPAWSMNDELPEVKRKIAEIQGRDAKLQLLGQQRKRIEQARNPFDSNDDRELTKAEQTTFNAQIEDKILTDMSLDAMNNGNSSLLKAYMSDDNVRQAMVAKGIVSEEDSHAFQQRAIEKIAQVEKEYNDEITHLNRISADAVEDGKVIPFEMLQTIATNNVYNHLGIKTLETARNEELNQYRALIAKAKEDGKLTGEVEDYERALEARANVWALTDLYQSRAEVEQSLKDNPTIGGQLALESIDKQIKSLHESLYDKNDVRSMLPLFFARNNTSVVRQSLLGKEDDAKKLAIEEEDKAISDAIDKGDFRGVQNIFELDDKTLQLAEEDAKRFADDYNKLRRSTDDILKELKEYGSKEDAIGESYNRAYQYGYQINQNRSQVVSSVSELKTEIGVLNNTLNEMRRAKLAEATDTFKDILNKYGRESLEAALASRRIGDNEQFDKITELYDKEDKEKFDEAITVYNFANPNNNQLYESLTNVLDLEEILQFQKEEQKKKNTTTNQNPSETAENEKSNNQSTNETESEESQKNGTTDEVSSEESTEPTTEPTEPKTEETPAKSIRFNDKGDIDSTGKTNIETVAKEDGTEEIQLKGKVGVEHLFNNDALFDVEKDASVIDNNAEVKQNPIVKRNDNGDFEVVSKGLIGKKSDAPVEEQSSEEAPQGDKSIKEQQETALIDTISKNDSDFGVFKYKIKKPIKGNINGEPVVGEIVINDNGTFFAYQKGDDIGSDEVRGIQLNDIQKQWLEKHLKGDTGKTSHISSTGEVSENSNEDAVADSGKEILNDAKVVINGAVIPTIKAHKDKITMDELADELYNTYKAQGVEEDILKAIVNDIRKNPLYNKLLTKRNNKLDAIAGVIDAQSRQSAIEEEVVDGKKRKKFTDVYSKAADALFDAYLSDRDGIVRKDKNGVERYYFSFQDLLNWCNEVSETPDTAAGIYGYLKQYILYKSKNEDYLYRIVDEAALDAETIFNSKKEIIQTLNADRHRLNIKQLIELYQKEDRTDELNELLEALDNVKVGDRVSIEVRDNKLHIRTNDTLIGALPVPIVSKEIDAYNVKNDGVVYDINVNNGDSTLKDTLKRWVYEENEDASEVNDILYSLAFDKTLKESDRKKLYKKFLNNKEIKALVDKGVIVDPTDIDIVAEGFAKLYRYIAKSYNQVAGTDLEYKLADVLSNSIDDYFDKLLNSYNAISAISHFPQGYEATVDYVTSGILTKQVESNEEYLNPEVEKQANTVKDAVADSLMDRFEFGFIPTGQNAYGERTSGVVYGDGGSQVDFPGTPGNTFGMIKDQNGVPQLVRAYPVRFGDKRLSKDVVKIQKAIKTEFANLLEDFYAHKEGSYEKLRDFVNKVFSNYNRTISRGFMSDNGITIRDFSKGNGFNIAIDGQPFSISIGNSIYRGERQYQTAVRQGEAKGVFDKNGENKDAAIKMFEQFVDRSAIGIHFDAMQNAINENYPLTGFMSRNEKGEFTVTIPNSKTGKPTVVSAKSYKDFLIDNNLVKINLKKTKDINGKETNFTRRNDKTQVGNQTLYVRFDAVKTPETINGNTAEQKTSGDARVEKVVQLLEKGDKREHQGNAIATMILGNSVKNLLKPINGYSILPKTIIFDKDLNSRTGYERTNALYNVTKDTITVGTKWLDMLRNPDTKQEALRKLVHEQLHRILAQDGNAKYIEQVRAIRDEFIEANKRDGLEEGKGIRRYEKIDKNDTIALEEFLVESLTSKELIDRLNAIDAKVDKGSKKKSLFQKIVDTLCKIFGWDVRKGSLYEKEIVALGDILNTTKKEVAKEGTLDFKDESSDTSPVKGITEETTSPETTKEEPPKVDDSEDSFDNEFDMDVDFDDIMRSNIDEDIRTPTIKSFIDSIPIENRAKMREQIDNGELQTYCK
jgi:hypothetical protein